MTTYKPCTVTEPSQALLEAAFLARDYHNGQGCPLYALQCGEWQSLLWTDYTAAACEFDALSYSRLIQEGAGDLEMWHLLDAANACRATADTLLCNTSGEPNETAHYSAT